MGISSKDFQEQSHYRSFPEPELIPETPGIYSWYYNFSHLKDFIGNREQLYREIESSSQKLSYPPLHGELRGDLGTKYQSIMENVDYIRFTDKKVKSISSMSTDEIMDLIVLLNNFASPLYIGVTKTLRGRYLNHLEDYNKARTGEGKIKKNSFGYRLNEMKIDFRYLIFRYVELKTIARYDIEAIEYIANRLFKPLAGRR